MRRSKFTSSGSMTIPASYVYQKLEWKDRHTGAPQQLLNNRPYGQSAIKTGKDARIHYETGKGGSYRPADHVITDHGSPRAPAEPPLFGKWTEFGIQYTSDVNGLFTYVNAQLPDLSGLFGSNPVNAIASIPWESLSAQAYNAMRPSMTADNSILNFLYELKDFKHLAQATLARLRGRTTTQNFFNALLGIKEGPRKDSPIKKVAKSILAYKFGYKPFVQDVLSLYATVSDFNKKFETLKKRAGTPQQRRYSTLVPGTQLNKTLVWSNTYGMPEGSVGRYTPSCKVQIFSDACPGVTYYANMRYVYQLPPEVNAVGGAVKAALDALGVRLNPRIIWDMIPFSFLIDWVVNVGEVLGRLSLDNLAVKVKVSEFCHSAKTKIGVTAYASGNWLDGWTENWYPYVPIRNCTRTAYRRSVGFPNLVGSLDVHAPSDTARLLAGALIVSRSKNF